MGKFKLNFLHLADGATIDRFGKVSIFGIFGKIFLEKIPGRLLKSTVVGNIGFSGKGGEIIKVGINIFDQDNKELELKPPLVLTFVLPKEKVGKPGNIGFITELGNLQFKNTGNYKIMISVNGKNLASKKFTVEKKKKEK